MTTNRLSPPAELLVDTHKVQVNTVFQNLRENASPPLARAKSPGATKNYFQFTELVEKATRDYEQKLGTALPVKFSWENPDKDQESEVITIGLVKREPGAFGQGAPFESSVKNLKPVFRESIADPDAPGYRKLILGKWFDNLVKFTCWSQTNKEAMQRAFWFEEMMEKYSWFFAQSGVNRVIFMGQEQDKTIDNAGKKIYGRSLLFFVKTEELITYSEKEIEEIHLNLLVSI